MAQDSDSVKKDKVDSFKAKHIRHLIQQVKVNPGQPLRKGVLRAMNCFECMNGERRMP